MRVVAWFLRGLGSIPVYRRSKMGDLVLRWSDDVPTLTPLQREVVVLIGAGLTNREIAARLGTTPGWVGIQVGRIVQRLGLTRRAEVAAWAWRGWSEPDAGRDAGTVRIIWPSRT